jgi:hypothetical protein
MDFPFPKKATVLVCLGLVIFMQGYCFITREELYPFAPFVMYSIPYVLPVHEFHMEAAGEDQVFTSVASMGTYSEGPMSEILYEGSFFGWPQAQRALQDIFDECLEKNCKLEWLGHPAGVMKEMKRLRAVQETYFSVKSLAQKKPDEVKIPFEIINDR